MVSVLLTHNGQALAEPVAGTEEVVAQGVLSDAIFEILRGALGRDSIALRRVTTSVPCSGTLGSQDPVRARVWFSWTKHHVQLCFQDRCSSSERVLGPFVNLDARAREETITVIESGLAALRLSCPALPSGADTALVSGTTRGAAKTTDGWKPSAAQTAVISTATAAATTPRSRPDDSTPAPGSAPAVRGDVAPGSATSTPEAAAPRVDAALVARPDASEHGQSALTLSARYGITRWSPSALAQEVGAAAAYRLPGQPVSIGFEVDYSPRFRARNDTLSIDATCLRAVVQLWMHWSLSHQLALDVQLGPALDWLWVGPSAATARVFRDARSTSHADPSVLVRVMPALRVYAALWVGIALQLDASWTERSYGFVVAQAEREVFAPDRVRMSLGLHARTQL